MKVDMFLRLDCSLSRREEISFKAETHQLNICLLSTVY